jgi:RsiW-degrading membrane proteinase PrsW (M82 family)
MGESGPEVVGTQAPAAAEADRRSWRSFWRQSWFAVLFIGSLLWLTSALVTSLTQDPILVPSVILMGSFLAPVTVVAYALSRLETGDLTATEIYGGFLAGGSVGLVGSALIETYLLPSTNGTFLVVGLVEESCKALIVLAVAHFVTTRRPHDGIVIGATVGAGFAAFESSGYAFRTIIRHRGDHDILAVLNTEISRAVFSPFAHITWTALFGSALFIASRGGRFRLTRGLVFTFVGIALLHTAWDSWTGWAVMLTKGIVEDTWIVGWPNTEAWISSPTGNLLAVWQVIYDGLLIINSIIGFSWLLHEWRRGTRLQKTDPRFGGVAVPSVSS